MSREISFPKSLSRYGKATAFIRVRILASTENDALPLTLSQADDRYCDPPLASS